MIIRIGLTPIQFSEDAAAKYEINYAAGTDAAIVMDDVYAKYADDAEGLKVDSVVIASLSSSNANIASIAFKSVNVNGVAIDAAFKDGKVKVNTLELDLAVQLLTAVPRGAYSGCKCGCRSQIDYR